MKWDPLQLELDLSRLDILKPEPELLLHLPANDIHGGILYKGIIVRFQPFPDLHVPKHASISERNCRSYHRLYVDLRLSHYVVSRKHVFYRAIVSRYIELQFLVPDGIQVAVNDT
ncbi:DNA helicase/primase complex-associated protein, partial [Striga asiatica]